jgi:PAS domain S-box-containing protein
MDRRLSVLIVEDSESDAGLIVRQLQKASYDVSHERVETDDQMRTALEKQPWGLVIADYNLPQFSATAALEILQKTGLDIPFIVVSGTIGEDKAVELMKSGAHDYIMKGNLARLIPAVERELSEAQTRHARRAAEEALKRSEGELRTLFAAMTEVVLVLDAEGRYIKIAPTNPLNLYRPSEKLVGKNVHDVLPKKDADEILQQITQALETRQTINYEYKLDIGSREVWFDGRVSPLTDNTVFWIARDITERKQAEAALRVSEERFSKAFRSSPDAVVVSRLSDGTIMEVNDTWERIFGYHRAESIGSSSLLLDVFVDPGDRHKAVQRLIEQGRLRDFELDIRRKGGEVRQVSLSGERIEIGDEQCLITIIRDITAAKRAAEALRKNEERLRLALKASQQGLYDLNLQTGEAIVSPEYAQLLGYDPSEFQETHEKWIERLHPEDREHTIANLRACVRGEAPGYQVEYRMRAKSGEWKWISSIGEIVERAPDGSPLRMVGTHLDITQRKRAELALKESEARFSAIFHASPIAISITRLKDSVRIDVNKAWEKITGLSREEALGHTPIELNAWANPVDRDRLISQLSEQGMVQDFEFQIRHKSGSLSYVLMAAEMTELAGERYMVSLAQDITDRKQAEEALKESEDRYRQVIEQINEILFSLDQNGVITFMSPVIRTVAGYEPEDLIGHPFADFIHPEDLPDVVKEFNKRMKGKREPIEYRIRAKSGEAVWLRSSGKVLFEGGEFKGIRGILTDVTEQRKAKVAAGKLEDQLRQSQKMEAIGILAGGVAHDFNNLLTIILGNADLMLGDVREDHPFCTPLEETRKAANRAALLTRQLLAFSRKQVVEPKILDFNEIIHNTQKMLGRLIGENIRLETNLSIDLSPIEADPGQVEQIIMNLAVNARDAMPEGGSLTLHTQNREADEFFFKEKGIIGGPGSYAVLRVTDIGTGMSPEIMERIFEPFFTTKGLGKGTGLGLSTVYGIVKQNRGYIFVQSAPGAGTTFEILLPKAEGERSDEVRQIGPQAKTLGSETILVVEDNEEVRAVAVESLNRYGYHVLEATDGESALKLIRSNKSPIHLLITDVIMPRMGGNQLAGHVRALSPATKVLFMSGYTDESISRYGVLRPGIALLSKPFTPEALAKKVREVLGRTEGEGSLS